MGRYNGIIMSLLVRQQNSFLRKAACFALGCVAGITFAQSAAPSVPVPPTIASVPALPNRSNAPDGAPELAVENAVSNTSVTAGGKKSSGVMIEEERVQGRLSSAHVSVGGARGYSVIDPTVGRVDRNADNGGKHVRPSVWELFRF
jgi:hypothetical protein